MGYRLEISEIKYKACGGKLYGYTDEKQLKSYTYLVKKGYLDGDECFGYGFYGNIPLSAEEFKEFIELYNEDCNEISKTKDIVINSKDIKELLENDNDKLLQWW